MIKKQYLYNAMVINVVDGDTIDVEIDLGFYIKIQQRLRLYGVNTKEMHSTNDNDKLLAISAKNYMIGKVLNKNIVIETFKNDKYGRMLAKLYIDDSCINDELLKENLAVEYFGKN